MAESEIHSRSGYVLAAELLRLRCQISPSSALIGWPAGNGAAEASVAGE